MRSLLEKAIVHLLNEEHDKFEALVHQFMVQRGRQIHEKLRQGDDISLTEGWDEEITAESYFTEADLEDAEDGAEAGEDMGGDDMAADDAASDLEADMGDDAGMGDDDMDGDEDMGAEGDMPADDMPADDMGGEGDADERLDDIEAQIAKLTAEFEKIMGEDGEPSDEAPADDADMGDEMGDDMGDDDADMGADDADMGDEMGDEDKPKMEGKMPPQFAKHMKGKKDDEKVEEGEDFDDITESVLADLERVVVDLSGKDGTETDGKKVNGFNPTSAIPQKPANAREGGKPIQQKVERHTGFERETPPASHEMPKRKNVKDNSKSFLEPVAKPSNGEGKEGPAGGKTVSVNTKSPLAKRKPTVG